MYKPVHFAENRIRRGVPSAKMTNGSDLGLKTLFRTNSLHFANYGLESTAPSAKMTKRVWSRAENINLDKLIHFAENR